VTNLFARRLTLAMRAFSLLMYTEQALPTWLFLKKSHTSLNLTVQSGSENAIRRWFEPGRRIEFSAALVGTKWHLQGHRRTARTTSNSQERRRPVAMTG
jgi:hypothetical protein